MNSNQNEYGVYCGNGEKDFAYRWLGALVTFKLMGIARAGEVTQVDSCYKTLDVVFQDGRKTVTVNGHFACFKRAT